MESGTRVGGGTKKTMGAHHQNEMLPLSSFDILLLQTTCLSDERNNSLFSIDHLEARLDLNYGLHSNSSSRVGWCFEIRNVQVPNATTADLIPMTYRVL